jgi:hypothetical protein
MEVSREMLERFEARLTERMREGFAGVYDRLDTMNGRVRKGEEQDGRSDERLKTLEREMRDTRRRNPTAHDDHGLNGRHITQRDVRLVVVALALGGAVLRFAQWIFATLGTP